jgi:hypothetical protein
VEAESRRLWRDTFDRPDSSRIGNGWGETDRGQVQPQLRDGKAVISGRKKEAGSVWLTRSESDLNDKFLSAQALVRIGERDRVTLRYMVFSRGRQARGGVGSAIAIARNARGEVVLQERTAAQREWTETPAKDESGAPMMWPEGDVELRIVRSDPKQGLFEAFVNDVSIGSANIGLRQRPGALDLGFQVEANAAEQFSFSVDEVLVERYR